MTVKAIDLLNMTGPDLLDHVEDLERACGRIARGWENPFPASTMPSPELCEKMAKKWNDLAAVFAKTRSEVYQLVRDEIHRESCGA